MPRGLTAWDLVLGPLVPLLWSASPRTRASMAARRGHPPPELPAGPRAWIHGASVGEILSAAPLLEVLGRLRPGMDAVLSCNTAAGLAAARVRMPATPAFGMPLDLSGRVREAFDRVKPTVLILLELELWPQLLAEAQRRGIPVLCVNARITERSAARYRSLLPLLGPMFGRVRAFLAQGPAHAERLRMLGVAADRVQTVPNLKGAAPSPERPDWIPAGAPLWVAGSTHPGEEDAVLDAWKALPGWRLLIAPRHPPRFEEAARILTARGIPFRRRTQGEGAWRVLLLDTVGELARAYAAADLAFVGGTLAPVGGHNLLEPAAAGVPVLSGPHTAHAAEDRERLETAGALRVVPDAEGLAAAARALAADPALRERMGRAGRETLRTGTLDALERALGPLLPPA